MRPAFTIAGQHGALVATALHAGHDLRPEVAALVAVDDATRLREEDPGTDRLTDIAPLRIVARRSRFEVDLNRPPREAVYRRPEDAWGLSVWRRPPPDDVVARSRAIYADFYRRLEQEFDGCAGDRPFLVLDLHSYNHRRRDDRVPDAEQLAPEVNIGTGTLDRARWASVVDRFIDVLREQVVRGHPLDVRENVRFRGGHFARWVHARYPASGVVLAIELKKTFMDEWTGEIDGEHLTDLKSGLAAAAATTADAFSERDR